MLRSAGAGVGLPHIPRIINHANLALAVANIAIVQVANMLVEPPPFLRVTIVPPAPRPIIHTIDAGHNGQLAVTNFNSGRFCQQILEAIFNSSFIDFQFALIVTSVSIAPHTSGLHVELDDNLTAVQIHHLTRSITTKVYAETGAILTVGIYATNEGNEEIKQIKDFVYKLVSEDKDIKQIHGFYLDAVQSLITFDLVFEFGCEKPQQKIAEIVKTLKEKYPAYTFFIIQDTDFSD